jgi:oligopeptide/dipeptide ABC transporter ATP-binding protein
VVARVHAVDEVSFEVGRGQTLGLVGESGCGKTTTARLILQLERPDAGELVLEGRPVLGGSRAALRSYRRDVQMVFQDPYASLNPRKTVEQLVGEPLRIHGLSSGRALRERVVAMLDAVNLPADAMSRYPHEFSGGQRQRLGIARALVLNPKLIVCDEPVSALDVSIRSQIINLLLALQQARDLTYILIAHDLAVVEHVSDVVAVMYLGKIVEMAPTQAFFANTVHPYSEALLSAVPATSPKLRKRRVALIGEVPSPLIPPSGCRFRTRCPLAQSRCAEAEPPLREIAPGHRVACHMRP